MSDLADPSPADRLSNEVSRPSHSSCCLEFGAAAFSGIGLLIASRAKTNEAVTGMMNLVMLPMWVLSGIFFSASRYPDAARPFIRLMPLTVLSDTPR